MTDEQADELLRNNDWAKWSDARELLLEAASIGADESAAEVKHLRAEVEALRRWKSTHAPRIDALEGLLRHAQAEAALGVEARATLASERAANATLTNEVEALRAEIGTLQSAREVQDAALICMRNDFRELAWERDRLQRDNELLHERHHFANEEFSRILAEAQALRADAARYEYICQQDWEDRAHNSLDSYAEFKAARDARIDARLAEAKVQA